VVATGRAPDVPTGHAGQYVGLTALVVISLLAAFGLTLLPDRFIWLLGLAPLVLGIRKLILAIRAQQTGQDNSPAVATGLPGVIGLTIANGGDNVAAYTPLFRTLGAGQIIVTLIVFAVGVAVWCLAGTWLVSHHAITRAIQHWGHWIVPAVFIGIGLYIFYKGGVLGLTMRTHSRDSTGHDHEP
jgi:cadmium resistance protein CadD (predicted permease)